MSKNSPFSVGTIVALNSHPFFSELNNIKISISGDPMHISPLMVVIEAVRERSPKFEEISGLNIVDKDTFQCKCLWFSSKTQQFEENWISSKQLKIIKQIDIVEDKESTDMVKAVGSTVTLITSLLEIRKEKMSSESYSSSSYQEKKNKHTPLLSFLCPPMVVTGTAKYEPKEPTLDQKTGVQIRWYSEKLIKCKYYNSHSDKFSEVLIPVEALISIPQINYEVFSNIAKGRTVIKNIGKTSEGHDRSVIKFGETIYKGGYYFVEMFDEINNSKTEVRVDEIDEVFKDYINEAKSFSKYRQIKSVTGGINTFVLSYESIPNIEIIFRKPSANVFYKIKYVGVNSGNKSTRYISECYLYNTTDVVPRTVVVAHCHKKKAQRFFFADKIEEIQMFDLNEKTTAKKKPVKKKE